MGKKLEIGEAVRLLSDGNLYTVEKLGTNPGVLRIQKPNTRPYWVTAEMVEKLK